MTLRAGQVRSADVTRGEGRRLIAKSIKMLGARRRGSFELNAAFKHLPNACRMRYTEVALHSAIPQITINLPHSALSLPDAQKPLRKY